MSYSCYIGVDPGASGGVAALDAQGRVLQAVAMPETPGDLLDLLYALSPKGARACAVLERVHSSPQMGVASAFTFGRGYGRLEAALAAAAIPYDDVLPRRWQAALGCLTGGDKRVSKQRAQQLFPDAKVRITHAVADALLLAEYRRRQDYVA